MEALEALEDSGETDESCKETESVNTKKESADTTTKETHAGNGELENSSFNPREDAKIVETESASLMNSEKPLAEGQEAQENAVNDSEMAESKIDETKSASLMNTEKPLAEGQEAHAQKDGENAINDSEMVESKIDESSSGQEDNGHAMLDCNKLKVTVGGELVGDSPETKTLPVEKASNSSPTSDTDEWECKACTYANPKRARKCKMCQTKKGMI